MKKILLAISMLLSLVACNRELIELSLPVSDDGKIVLNFNVVVPESKVATKSLSSPAIDSLTVIAFDENGYFVEAVKAICSEDDKKWKVEGSTRFKVTLSQAASARRLHFVANCPKDTSAIAYGPEAEVMNSLVTGKDDNGNKQDAYWQRVEVNSLLAQNQPSLGTIYLIRNFAKIRISSIPSSLTNVSYALLNVPQSGTVAPYNENKSYFQPYLNSNTGKGYSDLKTDQYEGFLPRNVGLDAKSSDVDSDDDLYWQSFDPTDEEGGIYTYESPASNNTAVLIKGLYGAKTCYYKIDLIDENSESYNILRNIEYIVSIDEVLGEGFDLVGDAANSPAGNNLSYSSSTRNLLNISDGDQRLFVEYTTKRVVVPGKEFNLKYKFLPTKDSDTPINVRCTDGTPGNDDPITITRKPVAGKEGVIQKIAYNDNRDENGYSTIIITPKNALPTTGYWQEEIEITSTYSPLDENGQPSDSKVTLSRIVTLYMLKPYALEVTCTPGVVEREINASVQLNINIPSNLEPDLFPLIFDIEAEDLSIYPDASAEYFIAENITMPVVTGKSIIEDNTSTDNVFRFQRKVTLEEYNELKESDSEIVGIPCYFKTNVAESATTVHVYNEYFNRDNCSFSNPELPLEMEVVFGTGADRYGEKPFTLTFTTNKTGKYVITNMNFTIDGVSANTKFDMTAGVPVTVNCTHSTWNTPASITIKCEETVNGENTQTFTGPDRNKLVLGNMSAGSNAPSDNTSVTIYNASNNRALGTATWSQLKAGGVEVTINNLADNMETDAVYFQYTSGGWINRQTYISGTLKVHQAVSGSTLNFTMN